LLVLAILAVLIIAIYLEQAGVPDFVKIRIVEAVRAQGWQVEFSRLRFHWYRGIVAEQMHLERADHKPGPIIFVEEAACRLEPRALRNFNIEVESVLLRGGRFVWPFKETNEQTATFRLDNVGGELVFKKNDLWQLRSLSADVLGVNLQISGTLSNASLIRDWKFTGAKPDSAEATQALWRRIVAGAGRVKFFGPPELLTHFDADAGDFQSLVADLKFVTSGVETPWGNATNALLHARVLAARPPEPLQASLEFTAEQPATEWCRARFVRLNWEIEAPFITLFPANGHVAVDLHGPETPWARARHAVATLHLSPSPTNSAEFRTDVQGTLEQLQSEWGSSDYSQLTTSLVHSGSNLYPSTVSCELRASKPRTPWGDALGATVSATATLPAKENLLLFRTNLVWPERLEGLVLSSTVIASNMVSPQIEIERVAVQSSWDGARLGLRTDLSLYGGALTSTAQLHSVTRELVFSADSTFDPHALAALLAPKTQAWFSNYSWQTGPHVQAAGRLTLPPWTNHHPDWVREIRPAVSLAGTFAVSEGAFRGVPFLSARAAFSLTNSFWLLTDLNLSRPEGTLLGEYSSALDTRDFHWRFRSRINPKIIRDLLEKETERNVLDYFQFTQPPDIDAEIWSRRGDSERLGIAAQIRAENFTFRGEPVTLLTSGLLYSNKFLTCMEPRIRQGEQEGAAPKVVIDLVTHKLYLTNAFGNLNPYSLTRAIGQTTAAAIQPYQFSSPPASRVNGVVDLEKGRHMDDLHFNISGGLFRWGQFQLERLAGNVDWVGDKLSLSEVRGAFRNGNIAGAAAFDFNRGEGATFAYNLGLSNADLRTFMPDVGYPTNRLEGLLNGEMFIRSARTADPKSWQGEGSLELRDGLIWDLPMFGVFSPVLNSIAPGLGNSRAKQARATFIVTNSVFVSHDLDIRATAMRMEFDGSIDFEGRVDGRIEAELLRDIPAIGFLISKLLWPITKIFESRITGAVNHPKTELLYTVPKILLLPLHPIKTLKEMIPEEPKPAPK
jgi:hypothetical protein